MDPLSDDVDIDIEELDRLERISRLELELKDANQKVLSRAGEIAILRSNLTSTKKAHQKEISDLIHANSRLKQEFQKELAEVQNDLARLKTERQFLQNEITDLYRSKPVRSATKNQEVSETSEQNLMMETPSRKPRSNNMASDTTAYTADTTVIDTTAISSVSTTRGGDTSATSGANSGDISTLPPERPQTETKTHEKKRTKQQQRDFEAMFRSGFDSVSISPKKKKLRTINNTHQEKRISPLRTVVTTAQEGSLSAGKTRASDEIVTNIEDAAAFNVDEKAASGNYTENVVNEFRVYIHQLALPGSSVPIMQQLIDYEDEQEQDTKKQEKEHRKSIPLIIQKALFADPEKHQNNIDWTQSPESRIDAFILTCMNRLLELLPENLHPLILALIQGSVEFKHVLRSTIQEEILSWLTTNCLKCMETLSSLSSMDEYSIENQPSFRTLRLPSNIANSTTNLLFYLDILDAMIGNYPATSLPKHTASNVSALLIKMLSPKLPSQVIVKAMYIMQYQSLPLQSFDIILRYLNGEATSSVSLILILDEINHLSVNIQSRRQLQQKSENTSESTGGNTNHGFLDLGVKYSPGLKQRLRNINELNMLLLKQLAVKKMVSHILWTNSVNTIAFNNGAMSSLIDCMTQQLEAIYDNDTNTTLSISGSGTNLTDIVQERVKLCEYIIRLLHGIWMISPDSPVILSNLEPKFGYQFIVSLSGVAFSTTNSKFSDIVIEQARTILEQCTTLSEADDIYLSMNPA